MNDLTNARSPAVTTASPLSPEAPVRAQVADLSFWYGKFQALHGVSMPIAKEVDAVVNHGATVEQAYRGLMARSPGHEVDGTQF
jgi:hypothetical protein